MFKTLLARLRANYAALRRWAPAKDLILHLDFWLVCNRHKEEPRRFTASNYWSLVSIVQAWRSSYRGFVITRAAETGACDAPAMLLPKGGFDVR